MQIQIAVNKFINNVKIKNVQLQQKCGGGGALEIKANNEKHNMDRKIKFISSLYVNAHVIITNFMSIYD